MRYILFVILLFFTNRLAVGKRLTNIKEINVVNCDDNNIIIGDSQSPYVDWGSDKFKLIDTKSGIKSLWKGGETLSWLLSAVKLYKIDTTVCNVAICIGTNGGFNKKDNILGLVEQLHITFPKSKLFVIQGSWGWGGVVNKTESIVREYYLEFKKIGVIVIEPPIGHIEPHGRNIVYQKIGENLDKMIIN